MKQPKQLQKSLITIHIYLILPMIIAAQVGISMHTITLVCRLGWSVGLAAWRLAGSKQFSTLTVFDLADIKVFFLSAGQMRPWYYLCHLCCVSCVNMTIFDVDTLQEMREIRGWSDWYVTALVGGYSHILKFGGVCATLIGRSFWRNPQAYRSHFY